LKEIESERERLMKKLVGTKSKKIKKSTLLKYCKNKKGEK